MGSEMRCLVVPRGRDDRVIVLQVWFQGDDRCRTYARLHRSSRGNQATRREGGCWAISLPTAGAPAALDLRDPEYPRRLEAVLAALDPEALTAGARDGACRPGRPPRRIFNSPSAAGDARRPAGPGRVAAAPSRRRPGWPFFRRSNPHAPPSPDALRLADAKACNPDPTDRPGLARWCRRLQADLVRCEKLLSYTPLGRAALAAPGGLPTARAALRAAWRHARAVAGDGPAPPETEGPCDAAAAVCRLDVLIGWCGAGAAWPPARADAPAARRRPVEKERAEETARRLLETVPGFAALTAEQWARRIGCGVGTVPRLDAWKDVMARTGRGRKGRGARGRVVALTPDLEATLGEEDGDLAELIADSNRDNAADPSPLDPHPRRGPRVRRCL
jgi:hypothetical protein